MPPSIGGYDISSLPSKGSIGMMIALQERYSTHTPNKGIFVNLGKLAIVFGFKFASHGLLDLVCFIQHYFVVLNILWVFEEHKLSKIA